MKNIKLILAALSFCALAVQATPVHKVTVQCNPAGPVYKGTMKLELDFANWAPAGACEKALDSIREAFQRKYSTPEAELNFNGLNYKQVSPTVTINFDNQNCNLNDNGTWFRTTFQVQEQSSGFGLYPKTPEMGVTQFGKFIEFNSVPSGSAPCMGHVLD